MALTISLSDESEETGEICSRASENSVRSAHVCTGVKGDSKQNIWSLFGTGMCSALLLSARDVTMWRFGRRACGEMLEEVADMLLAGLLDVPVLLLSSCEWYRILKLWCVMNIEF